MSTILIFFLSVAILVFASCILCAVLLFSHVWRKRRRGRGCGSNEEKDVGGAPIDFCKNRKVNTDKRSVGMRVLGRLPVELVEKTSLRLPLHRILQMYCLSKSTAGRKLHSILKSSRIHKIRYAVDSLHRLITAKPDGAGHCFLIGNWVGMIAHLHVKVVFEDLEEVESKAVTDKDADGFTLFVRVANRRPEWRGRKPLHAMVDGDKTLDKQPTHRGVSAYFYEEKSNRLYYLKVPENGRIAVYYKTPGSDEPAQFVFSACFEYVEECRSGCLLLSVDGEHVVYAQRWRWFYYNTATRTSRTWETPIYADAIGHCGNVLMMLDVMTKTFSIIQFEGMLPDYRYSIRVGQMIRLNSQTYVYFTCGESRTVQLACIHNGRVKVKTLDITLCRSDRLQRLGNHIFAVEISNIRRIFICEIFDDELHCEEIVSSQNVFKQLLRGIRREIEILRIKLRL